MVITVVKRISYGRQGWDFVNRWVRVDYGSGLTAYLVDGSYHGWGVIFGGTKRILMALAHLGPRL